MSKLILNEYIQRNDFKLFKKWIKQQPAFLKSEIFLTELYNVFNPKSSLEKSTLEFIFFNKEILKNKYTLSRFKLQLQITLNFSTAKVYVLTFISSIFKELDNPLIEKTFLNFYTKLYRYFETNEKNWDKEYEILLSYWKFIESLRNSNFKDYNKILIIINKAVYTNQQGFKI